MLTILGEMDIDEGQIHVNGSIGYVSQEAWITSATVQENILFGKDMEPGKYDRILKATCLDQVG